MFKMKRKLYHLLLCLSLIWIAGCGDDDDDMSIPSVSTGAVSNVTANAATVAGEITNTGGSGITSRGFVYSNADDEPTLDDSKVEISGSDNSFSITLNSLTSGSTYHVRAYATNGAGTGYGEVKQFATGNAQPIATNVKIEGTVEVNKELSASYAYSDAENDAEEGTEFQWYIAEDGGGSGEMAIEGATSETYTPADIDEFKYIRVGVTAKAKTGTMNGTEVKSSFYGPIAVRTTVKFMYNNVEVTYGVITSATTGRKWLDRNLGAPNTPSSYDDFANYGDLFQWGRDDDGHQVIGRKDNSGEETTVTETTTELSEGDTPGNAFFILSPNDPYNWTAQNNDERWQGVDGINNPCPEGWRIPSFDELTEEAITSVEDGYTKLKLTLGGSRSLETGVITAIAVYGYYWTSTINNNNDIYVRARRYGVGIASEAPQPRGEGVSCRCIKN
jgi:FlaG/FlaF family flagellin (archaellin)